MQESVSSGVVKGKNGKKQWGQAGSRQPLTWSERKQVGSQLLSRGYEKEAERFCNCGRRLLKFVGRGQLPDVVESARGYRKIRESPFHYGIRESCRSRLCARCAEYQYRAFRNGALDIVKVLKVTKKRRVSFLTLTFKKQDPTKAYIRTCIRSVRKFVNYFYGNWAYRYDKFSGKMRKTGQRIDCGALAVMEIGPSGNLHFHLLVYGYYHPLKFMSMMWAQITGDSYRLWINNVPVQRRESAFGAVTYILKYIRKPPRFGDLDQYVDFFQALHGVRRIHTYGCFYARPEWRRKKEPLLCPFTGDRLVCVGKAAKGEILVDYFQVVRGCEDNRIRGPDTVLFLWHNAQDECLREVEGFLVKSKDFSLDKLTPDLPF